MRDVLAAVGGAIMGVVLVLIVGALAVQVIGLQAGAVFDLSNTVVGITTPRRPIWPSLGIAAISGAVVFALTFATGGAGRRTRSALVGGFFVTTTAMVIWGFSLVVGRDAGAEQTVGVLEGWKGWVEKGGLNSAVHVALLLSVASLWLRPVARIRAERTADRVDA